MQDQLQTVAIAAVVDGRGYLHCLNCTNIVEYDHGYVWSDQTAHIDEACDDCGQIVGRTVLNRFPCAGRVEIRAVDLQIGDPGRPNP